MATDWVNHVRVATTGNLAAMSGLLTIDGVVLAASDRVLVKDQTTAANNGLYSAAVGAWARTTDTIVPELAVRVSEGTINAHTDWFLATQGTITVGTTALAFTAALDALQDVLGKRLPGRATTRVVGAFTSDDPGNSRSVIDLGRANVLEYGASTVTTETTGTCTAGGAITLGAANGFVNGNWLFMHGAGPAHGMSTPSAPTAIVQGTAGTTMWEFQIVAMTKLYGYTAASAVTTVTTANATLSSTNFIELYFTQVAGAEKYLVYARSGGAGTYTYRGAVIANPHPGVEVFVSTFRLTSTGVVNGPTGIPTTAPSVAQPNGLRAQVISGGGTTSVTVSPTPYSSATAQVVKSCNVIPFEDAMLATCGGAFGSRFGGQVYVPRGTYAFAGELRINRSITLQAEHHGAVVSSTSKLLMQDNCGIYFDGGFMASMRQPGVPTRVGDRVQRTLHSLDGQTNSAIFYCTAVSSGTWGVTATGGDPAWDFTTGHTTTDGTVTWTCNGNPLGVVFFADALESMADGISALWVTHSMPCGRLSYPKDLRTHWSGVTYSGAGPYWLPGSSEPAGYYTLPSNANNTTGKLYLSSGGTTGGVEPVWPKHIGDTVTDNGITWTCVDSPKVQGSGVLVSVKCRLKMGLDSCGGTGVLVCGDGSRGYGADSVELDVYVYRPSGHGVVCYGIDSQIGQFRVETATIGGGLAICDNSFYGNRWTVLAQDASGIIQNNPSAQSVQYAASLICGYIEAPGEVNWNWPAQLHGGIVATGFTGTATYNGIGWLEGPRAFAAGASTAFSVFGDFVSVSSKVGASLGILATFFESKTKWATGTKFNRIQHGISYVRGPTFEEPQYDSRGLSAAFGPGIRVGAGRWAGDERLYNPVHVVPTLGAFGPGDWMPWTLDATRLAIVPTRFGAEGYTARTDSTAYSESQIVSSGTKLFACVTRVAGTTASSPPAGLATATVDDFVTDGTVLWQCCGTTVQSTNLRAIPNLESEPIALAASTATIQIASGTVRRLAAPAANITITLGNTSTMPGDAMRVENPNSAAFTVTIANGGPGAGNIAVLPASTKCWGEFVMNKAGNWEQARAGVYF